MIQGELEDAGMALRLCGSHRGRALASELAADLWSIPQSFPSGLNRATKHWQKGKRKDG